MQQDNTTREIIHNESPHPFERISNSEGVVDYHICDYLQDIHCPKHMYAHMSCLDCRTVLHSVYQGDYYIQLRDYGYQKSAEKIMTILKYVVLTRNSRTIPPPGQIWTFEYPADTLMKVLREKWYKRVWRRLRLKITILPILKHTRYFKTMKYKLVYGG